MENFNQLTKEAQKEIIEMVQDATNEGRLTDQHVCDIHHEIFNTDYFIIGTYQAKKWLEDNIGVFEAIEIIKEYEQDNFGEITTDFSQPEKVCNMLVYLVGEELLNSLKVINDNWDSLVNEDIESEIYQELENL